MSRITIVALMAACAIFASCNRTMEPVANKTEPAATPQQAGRTAAADQPGKVSILLGGLMVYHKEQGKPGYEVGILPATNHHHHFEIKVNGQGITLPSGNSWTLEVTNLAPTAPVPPKLIVPGKPRRPDNQNGSEDFDWIIDFESNDFHGPSLEMTPKVLKPIIHLPNFQLYTKYKSLDLVRCQGGGGCSGSAGGGSGTPVDFGFVPETIAMDFTLAANQELILKDDNAGTSQRLVGFAPKAQEITITNVRRPKAQESDFQLYYDLLFMHVLPNARYNFDAKKSGSLTAYNPHPEISFSPTPEFGKATCCLMDCSSVLLGKRVANLE